VSLKFIALLDLPGVGCLSLTDCMGAGTLMTSSSLFVTLLSLTGVLYDDGLGVEFCP
jgi:hypothetical protein